MAAGAYQFRLEFLDNINEFQRNMNAAFGGIERNIAELQGQMRKVNKPVMDMQKSFGGLGRSIAGAFAGIGVAAVAMKSLNDAMAMQSAQRSIDFASGGVEESAKNMDFLRQTIDKMGLPMKEAMEGFKTLDASIYGTGLSQQFARDMFENTAMATTVLGVSADKTQNAFLAIGQMASKGVVSMEELRGQLGDALPGAAAIAARAMKMDIPDFNKMVESGKLLSTDFLPKFAAELKNTFESKLPSATNSAQANFNRFRNSLLDLSIVFGEKLLPPIVSFMQNYLTPAIEWLGSSIEKFSNLSVVKSIGEFANLSKILNFIKPLMDSLAPVAVGLFNVLGSAFNRFKGFLISNEANLVKIRDTVGWLVQKIGFVVVPLIEYMVGLFFTIVQDFTTILVEVIDFFTEIGNVATSTFDWIAEKVSWFGNMYILDVPVFEILGINFLGAKIL